MGKLNLTLFSRMLLLRGENCEEVIRTALGEGEGSIKEKFR